MVLLELFWCFFLIGFSSFGGLSMIPQVTEAVLGHGWMTMEQVTDIVAIAEMTPGPLGLNCATFAGIQAAGIPGAIAAGVGVLTPTLTLGAVAAIFFTRFKQSRLMRYLLIGIRPACFGMILGVVISLTLSNYSGPGGVNLPAAAIALADLVLLNRWKVGVPKVLLFSACAGLVVFGCMGL